MNNVEITVKKYTYAGLFMVTLATLMYEILLTRIFSVTMWYHFAFMAISVAMFGMTIGSILVYLFPEYFTQERTNHHLALSCLFFAIASVVCFLTHLSIPFCYEKSFVLSVVGLYSIALTYAVISIPFIFSGICVCLALTRFPKQVSRLYAADLIGAAIGCVLLIYVLKITDGPTAVFAIAVIGAIAALFFALEEADKKLVRVAMIISFLLAIFTVFHTVLVNKQSPLLRLMWVKGSLEPRSLYEKWNSFSRIRVSGNPEEWVVPSSFGISPIYNYEKKVRQLTVDIDSSVNTVITAFKGNLNELEFLKHDINNLAHYLRSNAKVLVIGAGGGRDILSALAFGQKSVMGIEINKDIIDTLNQRFGEFSGHLVRRSDVTFVNDEARSYVARQKDKFDIIQVPFIDTFAATAAGAFVLTENALYTTQAWKVFLEHLNPDGILTFSRWYFRDRPGEMYRLTSLACVSLKQLGIKDPRRHIIIVRSMWWGEAKGMPDGVGTILISKEPFSDKDLEIISDIAKKMRFELVFSPELSIDPYFISIASDKDNAKFMREFPINIQAPTDDSPFFFHMLRIKDMFNRKLWEQGIGSVSMKAVSILGVLLIIVVALTILCIIVPLLLTIDKASLKGALPFFMYFALIGLGFMLVEISQMQRLIIFLGHPVYGLSVVLFILLLSSGLGSFLTSRIRNSNLMHSAIWRLSFLLSALVIFGIFTPHIVSAFRSSTTVCRISVAAITLFPLGFFMGMAFPLGIRTAYIRSSSLTPWLWGINGATSVCASVLAIAIALNWGISSSYWMGFLSYVGAFGLFIWLSRHKN